MHRIVKTEVFYPYPPQQIWQVLTDRRALADWLMDNDFEPRVGHKFCFQDNSLPGLEGIIYCQVLELDEPKLLSYTWQDIMMQCPSIVAWTLTSVNGGTRLQLEHKGITQAIAASEFQHSNYIAHSSLIYEPKAVTQTLAPSDRRIPSTPSRYAELNSIILNSFLNGGWEYKLNQELPQVLVTSIADRD